MVNFSEFGRMLDDPFVEQQVIDENKRLGDAAGLTDTILDKPGWWSQIPLSEYTDVERDTAQKLDGIYEIGKHRSIQNKVSMGEALGEYLDDNLLSDFGLDGVTEDQLNDVFKQQYIRETYADVKYEEFGEVDVDRHTSRRAEEQRFNSIREAANSRIRHAQAKGLGVSDVIRSGIEMVEVRGTMTDTNDILNHARDERIWDLSEMNKDLEDNEPVRKPVNVAELEALLKKNTLGVDPLNDKYIQEYDEFFYGLEYDSNSEDFDWGTDDIDPNYSSNGNNGGPRTPFTSKDDGLDF